MPDETPKKTKIIIPRDGISTGAQQPRAVYDAISQKVLSAIGPVTSQRASHVDAGKDMSQAALKVLAHQTVPRITQPELYHVVPYATRAGLNHPYEIRPEYAEFWFADMTPCGHDVVLGPYDPRDRDKALRDEVAWLHEHNIPVCEPCIEKQHNVGAKPWEDPQIPPPIPVRSVFPVRETVLIDTDAGPIPVTTDPAQITGAIHPLSMKSTLGLNTGRMSSSQPALQHIPIRERTLPVPKWLGAGPNITNVDATKLLAGIPHLDVDYSAIEAQALSHYRRETADALRTRILSGQDDVEGANGWEEAGDVLSCTVFRQDHNSPEANPPSVSWTFSVTFDPSQCSVADISFGRV